METSRIRIGVSSCLLGNPVRFDGGHKLNHWIADILGKHVEFIPVCPEVECGMGIPREAMHLAGDPVTPRLVTVRSGVDLTERMLGYSRRRVEELAAEDLCGFIFKSDSPSSGMERVKVYGAPGSSPLKRGVGLFARSFMERFPLVPVEEEGRLNDPKLRENFIESLFTLRRWRDFRAAPTAAGWIGFHAAHKYLLMSHSVPLLKALGKLVATPRKADLPVQLASYEVLLLTCLRTKPTVSRHVNVLQHLLGYFKNDISAKEKTELLEVISNYQAGFVPLIVPVTLLRHHARLYEKTYLLDQVYLDPHPVELALRNHV
ncbi:DUF523 and DUF1722 domain-containing protein [Myxococcota bacterium]|nr:DUF523 and DUF1722 domain-containing protein [Myxococcota bacterium]MBU1413824.1 DUF523 and DUF1722 domain-containing protein [Myxococcota bacterium]MBU1510488.1 DUF523 and DUF1722 domain-containing protein [Myxococcota bacterium]